MNAFPPALETWQRRGALHRVLGREVFAVDAGPRDQEPLLVLHGFPSCSFDFRHALQALSARFRVVLHDHLGFGLSEKPRDYSYSLLEQAEVALALWRALGIERGHVLAHDYGTSVLTEILARRERGLTTFAPLSVTLCNGSVHIELARLRWSQRILGGPLGPLLAQLSSQRFFAARMRALFADPTSVEAADLEALWHALLHRGGRAVLAHIARYIAERRRFWHRWIDALTRLDLPAHVLWGRRDPVAVAAIAQRLAAEIPGARLTWLDDLGHYPMLEDPARWAAAVLSFYDAKWRTSATGPRG